MIPHSTVTFVAPIVQTKISIAAASSPSVGNVLFLSASPLLSQALVGRALQRHKWPITRTRHTSRTRLSATAPLKDYSSIAVSFFTSIRVPSALVAGSQLGSLFSLVKLFKKEQDDIKATRLQSLMIRLYHLFSLAALVLSINAIVTSTAAGTKLLMGSHDMDVMAESAYQFMDRELRYEFVLTRWSFLTSLLSFLAGITIRALLEFNLLDGTHTKAAVVVASTMMGLFCHLLSFVNSTLISAPNLAIMTLQVIKLMFGSAFASPRKPLEMVSIACFVNAIIRAGPLLWYMSVPTTDERTDTQASTVANDVNLDELPTTTDQHQSAMEQDQSTNAEENVL